MQIFEVENNDKRKYMKLLLLADESEKMIEKYLDRGRMFVSVIDENVVCQCVVTDEGNGILEIKNIATEPLYQRKGYAKTMIEEIERMFYGKYDTLQVGTGDSPLTIPFYEKCEFSYSHRVENFFINNYDHPIIEYGITLKDMIYLKKKISK